MSDCRPRCVTIDPNTVIADTNESLVDQWRQVREVFGPKPDSLTQEREIELFSEDIKGWRDNTGGPEGTVPFYKWLIWRLQNGTGAYGNLPQRKRDHVGISCVKCPYDTEADDLRSMHLLGEVPAKVDHHQSYMKVKGKGGVWGFECTYDKCPHFLATGQRYFHV